MEHEPSGLLSDAECAMDLPRASSILAVCQHPHGSEPLVKADGRVLENGSDFDRELALCVSSLALPHAARWHKGNFMRSACRAHNTIFAPATIREVINAVVGIGEVLNRLLNCLGFVCRAHKLR